jgi:Ca-activated chloride channel family protein
MNRLSYLLLFALLSVGFDSNAQDWMQDLKAAREAYQRKAYKQSFDLYRSLEGKLPKNVDVANEMGQAAYRAGNFEDAERYFNAANSGKKDAKNQFISSHNLGNARMKRKDYSGAVEAYKNALRKNPNDVQTRYNLSEALRKLKKNNQPPPPNNPPNQPPKDPKQPNKPKDPKPKDPNQPQQPSQRNSSNLPNKTVDRLLDELMKNEAQTKRKMGGEKGKNNNCNSGKDW